MCEMTPEWEKAIRNLAKNKTNQRFLTCDCASRPSKTHSLWERLSKLLRLTK